MQPPPHLHHYTIENKFRAVFLIRETALFALLGDKMEESVPFGVDSEVDIPDTTCVRQTQHTTPNRKRDMTNNNEVVTITLNTVHVVTKVENNHETPNYRKTTIKVGERMPKGLLSLLRMNPQRFNVVRV